MNGEINEGMNNNNKIKRMNELMNERRIGQRNEQKRNERVNK